MQRWQIGTIAIAMAVLSVNLVLGSQAHATSIIGICLVIDNNTRACIHTSPILIAPHINNTINHTSTKSLCVITKSCDKPATDYGNLKV